MVDLSRLTPSQRDALAGVLMTALENNWGRPIHAQAPAIVAEITAPDALRLLDIAAAEDAIGVVFQRPECVFAYCPNPDDCAEHCSHASTPESAS